MNPRIVILLAALLGSIATLAGERPAAAPKNALLDQLVGTWDVRYEIFGKDGSVRKYQGQVQYSWILDGKALQEIWTSDSEEKKPRPYGTTINFYDPKRQHWTAVWIYPAQGQVISVTGGEVDGSFVLTGQDDAGILQRWSTRAIAPDSALGRFDVSEDQGKTWRQVGVNHMHRHGS
jgi:hypothetical protein